MCLEAVDVVVKDESLLELFQIPKVLWPSIRHSWMNKQSDFLSRMDFSWDGKGPPKLLEVNGDTPSVLVETSTP